MRSASRPERNNCGAPDSRLARENPNIPFDLPSDVFPELTEWQSVGMHDAVFRAKEPDGTVAYIREDDGSSQLLNRLGQGSEVPAPRVLEHRAGWLKLGALPGVPLHDVRWRSRPREAAHVVADALLRLARADVTHGDMCVPNILGDLATALLTGIVDWRDAGRFDREIDVASAIWSCEYNGYPARVPIEVLALISWPRSDAAEVARLSAIWGDLAGPADDIAPAGA